MVRTGKNKSNSEMPYQVCKFLVAVKYFRIVDSSLRCAIFLAGIQKLIYLLSSTNILVYYSKTEDRCIWKVKVSL